MSSFVIVHFQPLGGYPPIQNLISILKSSEKINKIVVITTKGSKKFEQVDFPNLEILEINTKSNLRLFRLFKYLIFYIRIFKKCISIKPEKLMYFETISAFPCIYYKLLNPKTELFVHYHEYTSPCEYKNGMFINRLNYALEKKYIKNFDWISHTNDDRMNLFVKDNIIENRDNLEIFPNYPTNNWIESARVNFLTGPAPGIKCKKLVYIGSLSFQDTYIREICEFVHANQEEFQLNIYSMTYQKDVIEYISSLDSKNIRFHGKIDYQNIPNELMKYNIGLILYKGTVPNFVYNAPNKLFEYYHCGLDVWYPKEMLGIHKYKQNNDTPKIFEVDFMQIEKSIENYHFVGQSLPKLNYSAEEASKELIKRLEEN